MTDNTVVIAVGGTGGHVFPAIDLAKVLKASGYSVVFMGCGLSKNPFFEKSSFPYFDISSSQIRVHVSFFAKLFKGLLQSRKFLKKTNPRFVVGMGSYHSFPVMLAARHMKIAYGVHEANAIVGKVNAFFAKKATLRTNNIFDLDYKRKGFKKVFQQTPICRASFESKEKCFSYFGLDSNKQTLLIFGGSQGALTLNQLLSKTLLHEKVLNPEHWQIIHIIGKNTSREGIEEVYKSLSISACVKEYEKFMNRAWALADLVISRSGAATVTEQLFFCVPAIYIPFPFSNDHHQSVNAEYVKKIGGAFVAEQESLKQNSLGELIKKLLDNADLREQMKKALCSYPVDDYTSVSDEVLKVLEVE